jgi:hypothetical protein
MNNKKINVFRAILLSNLILYNIYIILSIIYFQSVLRITFRLFTTFWRPDKQTQRHKFILTLSLRLQGGQNVAEVLRGNGKAMT